MLTKMVEELGVLEIAKLYREKNITQEYAQMLLKTFMFAGASSSVVEAIVRRLVVDTPAHQFPMDYRFCADIGLAVGQMTEQLTKDTLGLVKHLRKMAQQRFIGLKGPDKARLPFIQYFDYTPPEDSAKIPEVETALAVTESRSAMEEDNATAQRPG